MHLFKKILYGIVKDATKTHDLSNVVHIFKYNCVNDYVVRTSQRFHIRREQHVTKKLKKIFLMTTLNLKVNTLVQPQQSNLF